MNTTEIDTEVKRLEASAAKHLQDRYESQERSDTDGFLSQWASGICSSRDQLQIEVVKAGGKWEFKALFDLQGNLVPAKMIKSAYGWCWALIGNDNKFTGFVGAQPKRKSTLEKKGYREGTVRVKAKADIVGEGRGLSGRAWAAVVRLDGGFSKDAEIVDNGLTPAVN
jgi:hypothetical protein